MSNNNYELIYITLGGKINIIKNNIWQTQTKFDGTTISNMTPINNIFNISKITQLNTGEFLYLGDDCNVYRVGSSFTNPTFVSDKQFLGITQLSNYKILLTSKDGKMYVVDDINNFDSTINPFFDDSTTYASVKQTFDGYVVAIDGTQCGISWRFDLVKNQLLNKTKLNLDEAYTDRVTLFTPDQTNLINLNCDPRYKNRIYKYVFSDKKFESSNDTKCYDGKEYESLNKKCYNLCPSGYASTSGDILSCWERCSSNQIDTGLFCMDKCRSGYTNISGVCWNNLKGYDRGIGIAPDQDNSACNDLEDVMPGVGSCTGSTPIKCTGTGETKGSPKRGSCKTKDALGTCWEYHYSCPDGLRSDGVSCWDDIKCTGGDVKTRTSPKSCKSNREMQSGLCYVKCNSGYEGSVTMCNPTNSISYVPTSTAKKSVSRGQSSDPVKASDITCDTDCCMFDLDFYNPLYAKPSSIVLPINLPVVEGLVGFYDASSFQNNIWYDSSSSNNNAVYTKGTFNNNGTFITGTTSSSILFPTQILPREYTVLNIAKYNGTSRGKILSGYLNNWFSGFANGLSGVAGRDKPITQITLSAFDDNWVFSLDTKTTYGANGAYYNTLVSTDNAQTQLSINLNNDPNSNSDFAIACVIVFDRILSVDEILSMQTWLTTKYADLYASTYTKTFDQLGYSCFNGSIGKVTNNYNNYSYASYKNGTVGCEWLNLPEKKNFNPIVCTSVSSEKYETFDYMDNMNNMDNMDNRNYFPDYIFYPLIIILILIIIYKRNHKD